MASNSAAAGSFAGQTWRTLAACRAGIRAGIVGTGSQPVQRGHHFDAPARPKLPSKKTIRKQPLFWTPFGGGCEVQSTGARGASHNKKAAREGIGI